MPLFPTNQTVYNTFFQALTYLNDNFNSEVPINSYPLLIGMAQTCRDLRNSMYVFAIPQMEAEVTYIQEASALVSLSKQDTTFISNRIDALLSLIAGLSNANINPAQYSLSKMNSGSSAVNFPDFVSYFMSTIWETPPSGLSSSNFLTEVQNEATAWSNFLNALSFQRINYNSEQYEAVNVMKDVTENVANQLSIMSFSNTMPVAESWNTLCFLQAAWDFFLLFISDPTNAYMQSFQAAVYRMDLVAENVNATIANVRQTFRNSLLTGIVYEDDNLMTFANRNLQDYSRWTDVATTNSLLPPYISANGQNGTTSPGQSLILPSTIGASKVGSSSAVSVLQNYQLDYLGTDLFFGGVGKPMPTWTGDFTLIFGYENLVESIGRRIITPLGSLMYEPDYGSLIPAEIGNPQAFISTGLTESYAESAIRSDPRVAKVVNNSVYLNAAMQIAYSGTVIPNGPNVTGSEINQVFVPL
jgi:phage baseplate assembly protein W